MNKKKNRTRFIPGFVTGMFAMLVVVVAIGAGIHLSGYSFGESSASAVDNAEKKLKALEQVIDLKYLDKVSQNDLEEGLYKGLLQGLGDPYSVYYTKEEYKELMESTSGTFYGIGAYVQQKADAQYCTIIKVFENGPADKAGMKANDIVTKVNDKDVSGEDIDKVVSMMRGDKGTEVKVQVFRSSEKKYIDLKIIRDKVETTTVNYKMLDNKKKIGYIQITEFDTVTQQQFAKALNALKKQGMKKVVFDVRDNPGGSYDVVCSILDTLLPKGTLVSTKDKYGNEEKQTSDSSCLNMPMAVIQNENSASASEIFAGAIQDFKAGKIVGTQSFGKGIVQQIMSLEDGSAIKLTIEKYYTPSGKNIHGKGITPDVKVETPTGKEDTQLKAALDTLK